MFFSYLLVFLVTTYAAFFRENPQQNLAAEFLINREEEEYLRNHNQIIKLEHVKLNQNQNKGIEIIEFSFFSYATKIEEEKINNENTMETDKKILSVESNNLNKRFDFVDEVIYDGNIDSKIDDLQWEFLHIANRVGDNALTNDIKIAEVEVFFAHLKKLKEDITFNIEEIFDELYRFELNHVKLVIKEYKLYLENILKTRNNYNNAEIKFIKKQNKSALFYENFIERNVHLISKNNYEYFEEKFLNKNIINFKEINEYIKALKQKIKLLEIEDKSEDDIFKINEIYKLFGIENKTEENNGKIIVLLITEFIELLKKKIKFNDDKTLLGYFEEIRAVQLKRQPDFNKMKEKISAKPIKNSSLLFKTLIRSLNSKFIKLEIIIKERNEPNFNLNNHLKLFEDDGIIFDERELMEE